MPFKTGMNEPALIEQAEVLFGRQERTLNAKDSSGCLTCIVNSAMGFVFCCCCFSALEFVKPQY